MTLHVNYVELILCCGTPKEFNLNAQTAKFGDGAKLIWVVNLNTPLRVINLAKATA